MQVSTYIHCIKGSVIVNFVFNVVIVICCLLIILVGVVSTFAIFVGHHRRVFFTHAELLVPQGHNYYMLIFLILISVR